MYIISVLPKPSPLCPTPSTRLLKLAQDKSTTSDMLTDIAMLLQNMFASGGGEGRKNALNSGVLDLTIKLLNGRDPIPVSALRYNIQCICTYS